MTATPTWWPAPRPSPHAGVNQIAGFRLQGGPMAKSKTEIIGDIESLIARKGGKPGEWFVGFSADPKGELAKHGFRQGDVGAIRTANTEMQAHDVVEYFVTTLKTKGDLSEVGRNSLHVYAYQTNGHTKP